MTDRTNAEGQDRTVPSQDLGEPLGEGKMQQLAEMGPPAASTELAPDPPMGDARPSSFLDEPLDAPVEEDEPTLVYRRTTAPPPFDMETPPVSMNEPCGLLAFLVAPASSLP